MKTKFKNPQFACADPFILLHDGIYYLYGTTDAKTLAPTFDTGSEEECGIRVFKSYDLQTWEYCGFALNRDNGMGNFWFWAPEVAYFNGNFYMVYTAEEHLAIAVSKSPLGPFVQTERKWLFPEKVIDGHFFFDTDGTPYLYYVRLLPKSGNTIFGARLNHSLLSVDLTTERMLIKAEDPWERVDCLVTEGPFLLKQNDLYLLTYSANHTRCKDYAVGYATSNSPLGEFKKYEGNPILKGSGDLVGVGHHSFTTTKDGQNLICAYHCHFNKNQFAPRLLCLSSATFLTKNGNTILTINEPQKG